MKDDAAEEAEQALYEAGRRELQTFFLRNVIKEKKEDAGLNKKREAQ